jgi:hypothetical protein
VRAQPAAVDQQMPQVPVVVRERLDDRGQSLGVSTKAQPLTVHLDIPLDELAELVEPVLVTALQIAPVERNAHSSACSHSMSKILQREMPDAADSFR